MKRWVKEASAPSVFSRRGGIRRDKQHNNAINALNEFNAFNAFNAFSALNAFGALLFRGGVLEVG